MGFFDSAQDLLNRGMAATERGTRSLSLKAQLADANRQRDRAFAALGESLYAATHDDAMQRVGREELYLAVEEANRLREDIERQIAEVEEQSAAARAASAQAAEERAAADHTIEANVDASGDQASAGFPGNDDAQARLCPACGAAAAPEHRFCASCGAALTPLVVEAEVIATEDVPASAPGQAAAGAAGAGNASSEN